MNVLIVLIPVSLLLGGAGLVACLWSLRNGQYDDLEGDSLRALMDDRKDEDEEKPGADGSDHKPGTD